MTVIFQKNKYLLLKTGIIILLTLLSWNCTRKKHQESVPELTMNSDSISSEKTESLNEKTEPSSEKTESLIQTINNPRPIKELLQIIPDPDTADITAREIDRMGVNRYYIGSFYLNRNGQIRSVYASSAGQIVIQRITITEYAIIVSYFFQLLGNEFSDEIGPEEYYYFIVTSEQFEAALLGPSMKKYNSISIRTLVTEISKDDIPLSEFNPTKSLNELFSEFPIPITILVNDYNRPGNPGNYLVGTFSLDNTGQLKATTQEKIWHIDKNTRRMLVYYQTGRNITDEMNPEGFYFFLITAEEIETALQMHKGNELTISLFATNVNKEDIPGSEEVF